MKKLLRPTFKSSIKAKHQLFPILFKQYQALKDRNTQTTVVGRFESTKNAYVELPIPKEGGIRRWGFRKVISSL